MLTFEGSSDQPGSGVDVLQLQRRRLSAQGSDASPEALSECVDCRKWAATPKLASLHRPAKPNNTVVMGRVIRNQRKGRGSIFTANTRLNKAPAQFRTYDFVRPPPAMPQIWRRGKQEANWHSLSAMDTSGVS